eukprot:6517692-Pyramimonas_sp.AAC.1
MARTRSRARRGIAFMKLHEGTALPEHQVFLRAAIENAAIRVTSIDGEIDFRADRGSAIGHSLAAADSVDVLTPGTETWCGELRQGDFSYQLLTGRSVISSKNIDIVVGTCIDDLSRMHAHPYKPAA